MRGYVIVALVASCLLFTTDARKLTQNDALSNSNGCLPTIPKCEQGACATRNIMGNAKWVCLRCIGGYEPVVDASGQDNIIQCVCPRGTFEDATGCARCPMNSFCPGGDKVENPTNRGTNMTCGAGLVTRNTGARTQSDCLAPAGFARDTPTTARACEVSEYAPLFNRLTRCLKCQSGLRENPALNLQDGQRSTKRTVCKLPPGRFMSQGLVRVCPQGFFREDFVDFDAAIGTVCVACNPGITTTGAGSQFRADCNVVLPGYGIGQVDNATSVPTLPAANTTNNGLPNATICDLGYYSLNGYCARCPSATVTTVRGAKSVEECVVPPGYFVPTSGASMTKCTNGPFGKFREGWVMHSDPRAATCTPCGDGIYSEARDLDDNPLAANGSMVMATSASCYIDAGFGMIAQGNNQFVGKECPINTYGAAGKVWGWAAAPCKPCPRNMITDNATRVTNAEFCVNDDGFGYASEGASRCAPGFYSAKGSRKPCQQCPAGRTTLDAQNKQRVITDCFVRDGFGVVDSTATDAFNPDISALNATQLAALPVLECPIGYYSSGIENVGLKCTACPVGSSTKEPARTNIAQCDVCAAGYGKATPAAPCTLCPYGTYQAGFATVCTACPVSTFYTPVVGLAPTYNSAGTTMYPGAFGEEACVPKYSQLSPEAGQAYIAPSAMLNPATQEPWMFGFDNTTEDTLADCIRTCDATKLCFVQYDAGAKQCWQKFLEPVASDEANGNQLVYKLPPSTLGSASSVKDATEGGVAAKMMASGYYAHGQIGEDQEFWAAGSSQLGQDARTFVNQPAGTTLWTTPGVDRATALKDCKKLCDNSNVCWGFFFATYYKTCSFRGGVDALNTNAFFGLPTAPSVELKDFKW